MKSKELQLQLIDKLDHVVAAVEAIVIDSEDVTRTKIDTLKSNLHNLLHTVIEIEKNELETPENSMQKMKHSVEDLKRKLSVLSAEPTGSSNEPKPTLTDTVADFPMDYTAEEPTDTETDTQTDSEIESDIEPKSEVQEDLPDEAEPQAIQEPKTTAEEEAAFETVPNENEETFQAPQEAEFGIQDPQPEPQPDLSDFIARPDEVPTSYVTSLTAMAQAQAGEQDMSQVAVFSTAMPDEKVVRQVEQRSDIFSKLKETEQLPFVNGQNNLKSLVDRLKTSKTVNDVDHRPAFGNMRSYIGINEKFLFINELFKGNIKEYGDMIQALDEAKNEEEMNQALLPLREKYAWNEQSLAYITLSDILKKKFGCVPQSTQA